MRRRLAVLAAVSAFALGLGAAPALASPVMHQSFPASDMGTIPCLTTAYTFASGDVLWVGRDYSAAHMTLVNVWATGLDGRSYRALGAETYSDGAGRLTSKVMFVLPGVGIADSINIVYRTGPNGHEFGFDHGTCSF